MISTARNNAPMRKDMILTSIIPSLKTAYALAFFYHNKDCFFNDEDDLGGGNVPFHICIIIIINYT